MSVRFSELDGAAVGVWGAGREIASFAKQLSRRLPSARIVAGAFDSTPDPDVREILLAPEALLLSGEEIVPALSRCDVVVRSPGVSIHRPELRALAAAGVPVTTATSLWLAERGGEGVIGVTGTKGKSTTAALISHLLRASGRSVGLAGNIGVPALELLDADPEDVAVVELSSYQIADLAVGPAVAVFTNLFPEHLDWHGSEATYNQEKLRLLELPGVRVRVLNARDQHLGALHPSGEVRYFGAGTGWDVGAGTVSRNGVRMLDTADLPLLGAHNAMNLCAALTALEAFGVDPPPLPESLAGFTALPHRLQTVADGGGVSWVDDSISTTPESTLAALASFPGRDVIVIGGGQDRGQDFAALASEIAARGAAIVGVPSNGARLVDAARSAGVPDARALQAADLAEAVDLARSLAGAESVVVLSPAAPSYDNYPNFEVRGERFAALARAAIES
jgi:UDP-N-acetylmuramoylalanine--D-glutamate ligase